MKREKGITLVALVVTIVVLLILAGVSINLLLGENGLITQAQEAKRKTAEAEENEITSMDSAYAWIEQEKIEEVEGVKIPEGFVYVGGTKESGIVISDNENDKGKYKGKESVGTDLEGNQYVFVNVEKPRELYNISEEGISLDGDTEIKAKKYTMTEIINGKMRVKPGDNSSFREPDILTYSGYDESSFSIAGFKSLKNMAETMTQEYDEMIKSIEKYKGFYIGRYELTTNGERKGETITNTNWYELYKKCTELSKKSKVKTRMIWGLQWDATCKWLESSGFDISNSTEWGNYKNCTSDGAGEKQKTGNNEKWKANNIYDFAGNCWEWTQEAYVTSSRSRSGGSYGNAGDTTSASSRNNVNPLYTSASTGTRPTLYIIP